MLIFTQTIAVNVVLLEPPIIPAHNGLIDFILELTIIIELIQFIGSPGEQRWLGHIRDDREIQTCNGTLIMDCIRDHAIFALMIEHNADLIVCQILLYMTIGKRMEVCVPL